MGQVDEVQTSRASAHPGLFLRPVGVLRELRAPVRSVY